MLLYNKKKLIIILIFTFFLITISIIKNESRSVEKKIQRHESKIFILEKNLLEASLEFQYLSSPVVLSNKIEKNLDQKYNSLNFSTEQKKVTSTKTNEEQKK